jgi:hypothetical protein
MQYPFLDKVRAQMKENLHRIDEGVRLETESIIRVRALKELRKGSNVRAFDILQGTLLEQLKDLRRNAKGDRLDTLRPWPQNGFQLPDKAPLL